MPEVRAPESPAPFQFSLRALLVVMTLIAVVAACFAWDTTAGIIGYLACVTLLLSVIRGRVEWRLIGDLRAAGRPAYSPAHVMLDGGAVALAAATAFCGAWAVAQVPFTRFFSPPLPTTSNKW